MKKMRYYDDGGAVGYEEDPKPGIQTDKEEVPKNPFKRDGSRAVKRRPRVMSSDEFLRQYKDSAPSDRIREEASKSVNKDKASRAASGTRMDFGGVSFGDPEMTREEQESIAKNTLKGAAAVGFGPAAIRRYGIGRNYERMSESERRNWVLNAARNAREMKSGGRVKKYASGGSVSSASKRADGCAVKGKTKGRFV